MTANKFRINVGNRILKLLISSLGCTARASAYGGAASLPRQTRVRLPSKSLSCLCALRG